MRTSFKILKVSHGTQYFNSNDHKLMLEKRLASVHPNTPAIGVSSMTQFGNFINAKKGDIFFICRSNESVDIIGMFKDERPLYSLIDNHYNDDWIDREFVLLYNAVDKNLYYKSGDKWWLPGNFSTCNEVKDNEFELFEEKILLPAFSKTLGELETKRNQELQKLQMTIEDISELQLRFDELYTNDLKIFDIVNNLTQVEKLKAYYHYGNKKNTDKQPVVLLRRKLAEYLVDDSEPLTKSKVDEFKRKLQANSIKMFFRPGVLILGFCIQYTTTNTKQM